MWKQISSIIKFSGSVVRVNGIDLLIACRLWPGRAEAVVGPEQRRNVRVLRGQGGVVPDEALDKVLVWSDAGRLRKVLGKQRKCIRDQPQYPIQEI